MTANSTLLATQCAAVVAVPQRCQPPSRFATGYQQLRTKLVTTKTYKPTIMAAGALVSKPSQLHANLVPKRNKMVVFAYPETKTIEISTNGFPEFIECIINNESEKTLELDSTEPFLGSEEFERIEDNVDTTSSFTQQAASEGSDRCASGYVTYKIEDNLRWIIAWRNAMDERNKVYTAIISGAKKGSIEKLVRKSTEHSSFQDDKIGYAAEAEIDPTSSRPTVKANLTIKQNE
ncbi:hypothetical protein Gotri_011000 [Gossypium trilobum]|uniref:Uncharacterized protein n=1 Tax=Gossypium trilobum TaxID=34281 RepID=A0A7J9ETX4_9ROSI|nr:hypothetical protein [Gossypium trilobum]